MDDGCLINLSIFGFHILQLRFGVGDMELTIMRWENRCYNPSLLYIYRTWKMPLSLGNPFITLSGLYFWEHTWRIRG